MKIYSSLVIPAKLVPDRDRGAGIQSSLVIPAKAGIQYSQNLYAVFKAQNNRIAIIFAAFNYA